VVRLGVVRRGVVRLGVVRLGVVRLGVVPQMFRILDWFGSCQSETMVSEVFRWEHSDEDNHARGRRQAPEIRITVSVRVRIVSDEAYSRASKACTGYEQAYGMVGEAQGMRTIQYLNRVYRNDPNSGAFVIDVKLEKYAYAFNEWDGAYFKRRDLDRDLAHFLNLCSEEIPFRYRIAIEFTVNEEHNPKMERLLRTSLKNYFANRMEAEKRILGRISRRILRFVALGALALLIAAVIEPLVPPNPLGGLLSEGFFIGGWVFFWEALSAGTFQRPERRKLMRAFKRFYQSDIRFAYTDVDLPDFEVDDDHEVVDSVQREGIDVTRQARQKKERIGDGVELKKSSTVTVSVDRVLAHRER